MFKVFRSNSYLIGAKSGIFALMIETEPLIIIFFFCYRKTNTNKFTWKYFSIVNYYFYKPYFPKSHYNQIWYASSVEESSKHSVCAKNSSFDAFDCSIFFNSLMPSVLLNPLAAKFFYSSFFGTQPKIGSFSLPNKRKSF